MRWLRLTMLALVLTGCSLAFDADRYRYEDDAGRDAQIPARDAGLDASDAAPAHDGGRDAALDAGRDAGGCAVACGDPTPICNPATRSCVACLVDPDCDDGDPCTVDRCGIDNACSHADDSSCIAEVSAGFRHTCARRVSGQVLCWGDNLYGEAGNGRSGRQELTPVTTSFLTDARDVSAGFDFSCAVRSGGGVRCWGINSYGQLGDGTMEARTTPIAVTGLSDSVQVAASFGLHACAARATGTASCWGANVSGQLGNADSGTSSPVPIDVAGLADVVQVTGGFAHSCALRSTGELSCWGGNNYGQLGIGTTAPRLTPVAVPGITDAIAVSTGLHHTCALSDTGQVLCWGRNDDGQLGNGTMERSTTPVPVAGLTDAIQVSAGDLHTCAVRSDGQVVCWGAAPLGDGTTVPSAVPVAVGDLVAIDVSAGGGHTCARPRTGGVVCWGNNSSGQLGDGSTEPRTVPTAVVGL